MAARLWRALEILTPISVQRWLRDRRRRAFIQFAEEADRVGDYVVPLSARVVLDAISERTNGALTVKWLGTPIWQFPLDAWVLQEVIGELRPDLIIETGTYEGGSAYYFASLCDLLGKG